MLVKVLVLSTASQESPMHKLSVIPGGALQGRIRVPGDKSISHRAIMLGAIADGTTQVRGFLNGEDCLATVSAFRHMGVNIREHRQALFIDGVGMRGLQAPSVDLDCGNSGTSMRLLCGLLSAQNFDSVMTGDASLQKRPMRRVSEPLGKMGARIRTTESGCAPLQISASTGLRGIAYQSPVSSAQIKSSLMLAALYAEGATQIIEPSLSRDHTERMLRAFCHPVESKGSTVTLEAADGLVATDLEVPGDISSAAFFILGASIAPGSDLIIESVGLNPTRTGCLDIFRSMGADIEVLDERQAGGEPLGDLRVRHAPLSGARISGEVVARAIDEFPAIFIAAACAEGDTVLTDAAELRVKESDRIAVMAAGLQVLGIEATPTADGMQIRGGQMRGASIDSHGDHRIAMSFAMAGLRAAEPIQINDCAAINTSFPGFAELAANSGLNVVAA